MKHLCEEDGNVFKKNVEYKNKRRQKYGIEDMHLVIWKHRIKFLLKITWRITFICCLTNSHLEWFRHPLAFALAEKGHAYALNLHLIMYSRCIWRQQWRHESFPSIYFIPIPILKAE